ncbi:MAG: DUF1501 domain-containing protein [Planctomycetes bacterium]|nr:DUF1501 domain-containing protein [Planctomycetota bacterium]
MDLYEKFARVMTRRSFLGRASTGIGTMALASLLNGRKAGADDLRTLHHAPKAKRVIHLYMAGGASHLETFDYRPKLAEMDGKPMPESFTKGQPIAQLQGNSKLMCYGPQVRFHRYGKNGVEMSEHFPKLGAVSDDVCVVRSLVTEQINHDPAHTFMNTGTSISGRPSMGSWLWYGLGADCDNLPGFVVLTSNGRGGQNQPIATRQWSSGFIPSKYQGVHFRSQGEPVLYLGNPSGVTPGRQRDVIDSVDELNKLHQESVDDPEIATRISQYEMAFKMQTSVPALMNLSDESEETLKLYGTKGADGSFAANCLLARRLAERGVRFIQLYHRDWDHHGNIKGDIKLKSEEVDGPAAALITDLKRRGMLEDTLILYGSEFGRTPMAQGNGRDHHIKGFSCWLAGGGVQGGLMHGSTDDLGYNAEKDIVHVHDLHATMLHLLGLDHKRLTFKFQGRDFRLTDVHGNVVKKILA